MSCIKLVRRRKLYEIKTTQEENGVSSMKRAVDSRKALVYEECEKTSLLVAGSYHGKEFRQSLSQFNRICLFTKLNEKNLAWSFYRGCTKQKNPLIDENEKADYSSEFDPSYLKEVVSNMMFAYGDNLNVSQKAVNMVLQNTISTLVTYCNSMYTSARMDKRGSINYMDFINLITRSPPRFHRFMSFAMENDEVQLSENPNYRRPGPVQSVRTLYETDEYFREFCDTPVIDHHFTDISARFKQNYHRWDVRTRDIWASKRRTSFCCPADRLSPVYVYRFHQAIGCPPLETDMIYYLDYISREYIMEVVHEALVLRTSGNFDGNIEEGDDYKAVLVKDVDVLFRLPLITEKPVNSGCSQKRKRPDGVCTDQLHICKFRTIQNRMRIDELRCLSYLDLEIPENVTQEYRRDWWKKHHGPVETRQTFHPISFFKMRSR